MPATLLIIFPFLIAFILLVFRPSAFKTIAITATLVEIGFFIWLLLTYDRSGLHQHEISIPWISSAGISFAIGMDNLSLMLTGLTVFLMPFIVLTVDVTDSKAAAFYGLILFMQSALIGVFTALDGMLFYIFWELALIPVYFICLIWGGADRGRITLKFFIYTLAGSLLMLIALLYLYSKTPDQSFAIASLYKAGHQLSSIEQQWIFWGLFIAFAIKMPLFPFHTWQPETYSVAPTAGTMLLSGIMLKMGIYGVMRWLIPMVPLGVEAWASMGILLSIFGVVYAGGLALIQTDFKRVISYSSISHVGLIAAGIFTLDPDAWNGAIFQMLSHGLVVVGLFYIVHHTEKQTGTRLLDQMGGLRIKAPKLATVFLIVLLGSVALPLTSGFIGEFLLLKSLVKYDLVVGIVAGLTIIVGAAYMLRAYRLSMNGVLPARLEGSKDLDLNGKIILYPVALLILLLGVFPAEFISLTEPVVKELLEIGKSVTQTSETL